MFVDPNDCNYNTFCKLLNKGMRPVRSLECLRVHRSIFSIETKSVLAIVNSISLLQHISQCNYNGADPLPSFIGTMFTFRVIILTTHVSQFGTFSMSKLQTSDIIVLTAKIIDSRWISILEWMVYSFDSLTQIWIANYILLLKSCYKIDCLDNILVGNGW